MLIRKSGGCKTRAKAVEFQFKILTLNVLIALETQDAYWGNIEILWDKDRIEVHWGRIRNALGANLGRIREIWGWMHWGCFGDTLGVY